MLCLWLLSFHMTGGQKHSRRISSHLQHMHPWKRQNCHMLLMQFAWCWDNPKTWVVPSQSQLSSLQCWCPRVGISVIWFLSLERWFTVKAVLCCWSIDVLVMNTALMPIWWTSHWQCYNKGSAALCILLDSWECFIYDARNYHSFSPSVPIINIVLWWWIVSMIGLLGGWCLFMKA